MVTKFTRAVKKCGNENGVRELYYKVYFAHEKNYNHTFIYTGLYIDGVTWSA